VNVLNQPQPLPAISRDHQLRKTFAVQLSFPSQFQRLHFLPVFHPSSRGYTERNGFVTATKLGTTNIFFIAATKNFAAATKRFFDRTKQFVVTKYFCYPYFNK